MDFADTNLKFGNLPLVALGARSSGWQKKNSEVPKSSRALAIRCELRKSQNAEIRTSDIMIHMI
jgi:hypothetical protein